MLLTSLVLTLEDGTIGPRLATFSVLEIVSPVTFIHGTIDMVVDTITVGFVIDPVSIIDVTVDMCELSFAMGSVVFPVSLVLGAIEPDLHTIAISETSNPLSCVFGSSCKSVSISLLPLGVSIVCSGGGDCLSGFFNCKVSTIGSSRIQNEGDVLSGHVTSKEGLELNHDVFVFLQNLIPVFASIIGRLILLSLVIASSGLVICVLVVVELILLLLNNSLLIDSHLALPFNAG